MTVFFPSSKTRDVTFLFGGLEMFGTFFIFPYIGNNNSNRLSYFSEGLKPPTSFILMNVFSGFGWTKNFPLRAMFQYLWLHFLTDTK